MELVESRILIPADSTFTEAIKDGKIAYPRTSDLICNKPTPYHHNATIGDEGGYFYLDDSNFNFNFGNLTSDANNGDDSNESKTTLASISASSFGSAFGNFVSSGTNNNNNNSSGVEMGKILELELDLN